MSNTVCPFSKFLVQGRRHGMRETLHSRRNAVIQGCTKGEGNVGKRAPILPGGVREGITWEVEFCLEG